MIDFQTVYIRDVAELNQINFIAVLRIECGDTAGLTNVLINGADSKFIRALDGRVVFAHLPEGVPQQGVAEVKLKRERVVNGEKFVDIEYVDTGEGFLDYNTRARLDYLGGNAAAVSFYSGILQLRGDDFSSAQRVKINNTDVQFSIVSKTEIMCDLPKNASNIDSVDVITSSKTINRRTYFEYMVGESPAKVMGTQKLIQQFVKLLMTTPGSDIFNPASGAGLQGFVGTNFSPDNANSVVAQVTFRVIQCGLDMTLRQTVAGVPADERLSDVQVLGVSVDPDDPTIMSLSLRLNTFGGRSAQFSTMLGEVIDYTVGSVRDQLSTASSGY